MAQRTWVGDDGNPVIAFANAQMTYCAHNQHCVVTVEGELDVYEAPTFRDQLAELIDQGEGDLIINMQAVDFLDSTCLGVLVGARLRQQPGSRAIRVVAAKGRVRKILRITGLTKVFDLHESVADALHTATALPTNG